MSCEVVDFPLGRIVILCEGERVVRIHFLRGKESLKCSHSTFSKKVAKEIREYLNGKRKRFTVKFSVNGSEFAKRLIKAVCEIPYGETRSYGDLAKIIDRPKAARAVGRVMAANRIPIIIPCHRVVKADGSIGGYSGGIDIKRFLLKLEQK